MLTSWVLVLSLAVKVSLLLWNHQTKVNVDQFLPTDLPWSCYKMWMFPLVQLIGLLFKGVLEQMTVHNLSILIFKESSNWQAKQAWARSSGHRKTLSEPENGIFSRFRLQSIVLCMDTIFIFKWPVSNFLSRINKDQFQVQKMKQLSETISKYGLTSKYYYITILKSYWYIQVSVKGLNSGVISKVSPAPKRVWRPTNFISEFIFQQHKQQKISLQGLF